MNIDKYGNITFTEGATKEDVDEAFKKAAQLPRIHERTLIQGNSNGTVTTTVTDYVAGTTTSVTNPQSQRTSSSFWRAPDCTESAKESAASVTSSSMGNVKK